MRKHVKTAILAILAVTALTVGLVTFHAGTSVPTAAPAPAAAARASIAGGTSLDFPAGTKATIESSKSPFRRCTLTAVFTDGSGKLYGLSSGRCAYRGQSVYAAKSRAVGAIGQVVYEWPNINTLLIRFTPSKVTPTYAVKNVRIRSVSTVRPRIGQNVCVAGGTSGKKCGFLWYVDAQQHFGQYCATATDQGAPVVVGTTLVAMYNAPLGPAWSCISPSTGTDMNAIRTSLRQVGITSIKLVGVPPLPKKKAPTKAPKKAPQKAAPK